MRRICANENGMALFIALMLTLMLTLIGIGIIKSSNDEVSIAGNELNETKAFYVAESGLDKSAAAIQSQYEATESPPTVAPAETTSVGGIVLAYGTVQETPVQKTLAKGSLAGLKAMVHPHTIRSTAYDSAHNTEVTLEESFEVAYVPIFQFAVFYDNDLEIAPGPPMVLAGRVHSNGDLYIQSGDHIDIESYLTAHGDILHGRKPGSGQSTSYGDVNIMGLDGSYHSMKDGAGWLDSDDPDWFDSASTRWGGRVQDATFGQDRLSIPLDNPDDPHLLVDRASSGGGNANSMELKAGLKVVDGKAWYDAGGGSWIDVTASLQADYGSGPALKETTFYDKREETNVTVYDINVDVLKDSPYYPSNGIIYTADNRSGLRGTRLNDAADVGQPLTFASENSIYTKGNVNSINKQPMAIICDALTILSDNWSDNPTRAASYDKTKRQAINTVTNFSYITGNKETGVDGSAYNGGLENLPRFLEDWSSRTLTYRGSIVNLWLSETVDGDWSGSYYTPPNRDWAFDPDLNDPANLPPGTPTVRAFIRWGWHQTNVGYVLTPSEADVE